jgi:trimeric autotransporter adhesin
MKKIHLLIAFFAITVAMLAQNVSIGTITPGATAALEIKAANKGLLIPGMGTSAVTSISNPAKGLLVYDSVVNQLMVNMGNPSVSNWQNIVFTSGWSLADNTGTTCALAMAAFKQQAFTKHSKSNARPGNKSGLVFIIPQASSFK